MDFTITRHDWLRGEGGMESRLLRPEDDSMCCLGQIAAQMGIDSVWLEDTLGPSTLFDEENCFEGSAYFALFLGADGLELPFTLAAMNYNDDKTLPEWAREIALTELFRLHGHTLIFVD